MRWSAPFRAMAAADMPMRCIFHKTLFDNACIRSPARWRASRHALPSVLLPPWRSLGVQSSHCPTPLAGGHPPERWWSVATATDIPLHGPLCDAAQELYATSATFRSTPCVVRPVLHDGHVGHSLFTIPAISLAARVWFPGCAVRVLKPAAFMSGGARGAGRRLLPWHLPPPLRQSSLWCCICCILCYVRCRHGTLLPEAPEPCAWGLGASCLPPPPPYFQALHWSTLHMALYSGVFLVVRRPTACGGHCLLLLPL